MGSGHTSGEFCLAGGGGQGTGGTRACGVRGGLRAFNRGSNSPTTATGGGRGMADTGRAHVGLGGCGHSLWAVSMCR